MTLTPAIAFTRPITEADITARLAEVVDHFAAKYERAPSKATAAVVGNRIRVTLHHGERPHRD